MTSYLLLSVPTFPNTSVEEVVYPLEENIKQYGNTIAHVLRDLQPRLHVLVLTIFVMNIADGLLTIVWVFSDLATEANPVMAYLLKVHPGVFMAGKLGMICGSLCILLQYRHRLSAILALFFALFLYSAILAYHGMAAVVFVF